MIALQVPHEPLVITICPRSGCAEDDQSHAILFKICSGLVGTISRQFIIVSSETGRLPSGKR